MSAFEYPIQAICDTIRMEGFVGERGPTQEEAEHLTQALLDGPLDDVRVLDKLLRDKMAKEGLR